MRARLATSLAVLAFLGALLAPAEATAQTQRTISVAGEASLTARNDAARVAFGVSAVRATRRAALDASSRRLRRVIAAIRGRGVAAADIRTGSVNVVRRRDRRGRPLRSFRAGQSTRAVVRDAPQAGAVVSAAVEAGASSVSGPSFFVSDPRALVRRALGAAFQDARLKAQELARQAGLTLGRPLAIRDSAFQDPGGVGEQEDQAVVVEPRSRATPAPTRPGNTRVDAVVDVVFEAD